MASTPGCLFSILTERSILEKPSARCSFQPFTRLYVYIVEERFAKMLFIHFAFALLVSRVAATRSQVSIPQKSAVISSATSLFAPAVTYAGPTGSVSAALKTPSTTKVAPQVLVATPSSVPYWLESITHQGISAFNSNPGNYQVFRNVQSFGAKGEISVLLD